jgi:hypothetical protein
MRIVILAIGAVLAACSAESGAAEQQQAALRAEVSAAGIPRYDPATEATVVGTVTGVRTVAHGNGHEGVHVDLAAGSTAYDVHLGPSFHLEEIDLRPQVDDELQVLGSIQGGEPIVLVAREVRRGDRTWTLRDPDGRPRWRGRGRGRGPAS